MRKTTVFISSTALDLPEHRKEVMDACLRQGMFPVMIEHLSANVGEAILSSLKKVEEADIYIGVLGYRYGYVPKGQKVSITEMEYNRAVERGIPRLFFFMDDDHPVRVSDVEMGEGAAKLKAFKDRVREQSIVSYFKSAGDLRANVINSLSNYRARDEAAFHYVSDIPNPPETYIAHPYTLLQTHSLVGRQQELNLLTDWVARPASKVYQARVFGIVAIGGMGKSALAWKWFNDIAPNEMRPLAGRMWWSFYEANAMLENFITRALAYVTRRPLGEVQEIPSPEREAQLLTVLDREPFLLVLDGLERILIAYARMDAAHLEDAQVESTKNLRKSNDPRDGRFLRRLTEVKASRILVSTRLYPAELETGGGYPIPGAFRHDLVGLTDEEAIELWRVFGISGSRDLLLQVFATFDKHPLLIQALAGEVKRFRRAPGNFEEWRRSNPQFDPNKFPNLQDARSQVLKFALRGLDDKAHQTLQTLAAFRMPPSYDTLAALLIGEGRSCANEHELDAVLTELEDRGLIGWDKRSNHYDLQPVVRGAVWGGLGEDTRRGVYRSLQAHLEALPQVDDWHKVNSLEDLTPTIELFNTLIGLGHYDEACNLFYERLDKATLYRLIASRQRSELLQMLFPDGLNELPRLSSLSHQAYTLSALASGYHFSGQPGRAAPLFRRSILISSEAKDNHNLSYGLLSLSETLRLSGELRESENAARRALIISRDLQDRLGEAASLQMLGLVLAARGAAIDSESALYWALGISIELSNKQLQANVNYHLAQRALWFGEFASALLFANRAWELAQVQNNEGDFIRSARAQGEAALGLDDLATADERLHHALTRARMVNFVEEELLALVALAELRRRQGDIRSALELLDDVWEAAERGPYLLILADAQDVLAQAKLDAGGTTVAVEAAVRAFHLSWCDGPPFDYSRGVIRARKHLQTLGEPEPSLPSFDGSRYEPMPEFDLRELYEQSKEEEFQVGPKPALNVDIGAPVRSIDNIIAFFKASGYTVKTRNPNDLQITPTRPIEKKNYGSSLVRCLEDVPRIEDIQEFCKEALLIPDRPASGYKSAFLVCPRFDPVHQLQAAVYQDRRLAVVPMTYEWVLESNAQGEQRKNLQRVIDAFLGRDDPFLYSLPVSVPGDFYGRNDVVAAIVRDLDRDHSVGLFGMRKVGKTSLIQHILRTRTGPTIYIDCQGITHPATVLRHLPQGLLASMKKLMPTVNWPVFDYFADVDAVDLEILSDAVNRYLRDLYELYVVQSNSANKISLIIDEVDRIVPDSSLPGIDIDEYEALFGTIRGLGQGVERILVCMVAGFSANITQKDIGLSRGVAGNPVYAFFNIHRLKPMMHDEIALMMDGLGSRARLLFSAPSNKRLYQWGGGHPYLSRLLGSIIHRNTDRYKLKRANVVGSEVYEVDEIVVDRAANDLLNDVACRPLVAQILERFNDPVYKAIFMKLSDAGLKGCRREILMKLAHGSTSKQEIIDALNSLEVSSLLWKDGNRFKFFARLLYELIRRDYV